MNITIANALRTTLGVAAAGILATAMAGEDEIKLKDGPNRDLVAGNCVMCHSLDYIPMNSPFLKKDGWEAEVNKMAKVMGAPISPNDMPLIVDYLTKHYGAK